MSDAHFAPDAELERRLEDMSRPENQGEGLTKRDFTVLTAVTVVVPVVALFVGWYL